MWVETDPPEATNKRITIRGEVSMRVNWRDSSGNYFSSVSTGATFSPIQRMEAPISEEEIQQAYANEELHE
jgi:hypothetical protein